jgi:hypothetical protein
MYLGLRISLSDAPSDELFSVSQLVPESNAFMRPHRGVTCLLRHVDRKNRRERLLVLCACIEVDELRRQVDLVRDEVQLCRSQVVAYAHTVVRGSWKPSGDHEAERDPSPAHGSNECREHLRRRERAAKPEDARVTPDVREELGVKHASLMTRRVYGGGLPAVRFRVRDARDDGVVGIMVLHGQR